MFKRFKVIVKVSLLIAEVLPKISPEAAAKIIKILTENIDEVEIVDVSSNLYKFKEEL